MIVILSMTNLSAQVPGPIAMCVFVYMIIVDLRGQRDSFIFLYSKTRGDSIRLAPEDISPQLIVGMLTSIKYACLPLFS